MPHQKKIILGGQQKGGAIWRRRKPTPEGNRTLDLLAENQAC